MSIVVEIFVDIRKKIWQLLTMDQNSFSDNMSEMTSSSSSDQVRLTNLPPEICEHIASMIPSLSLYSLPTLSPEFASIAAREMAQRHKKVNIFI